MWNESIISLQWLFSFFYNDFLETPPHLVETIATAFLLFFKPILIGL